MKNRNLSFKGKTRKNAESRKRGASYGYLQVPKGVDVFTAEGNSSVEMDIMPYLVTDKRHPDRDDNDEIAIEGSYWYKRPFKVHRSVGVKNEVVVCPASFGKRCPICDYRDKLRKDGRDFNDDELKVLRPSERNLYAIIVKAIIVKNKKQTMNDKKIHLFDFSDYLFQEKFEEQLSDKDGFEIFPDPQNGLTLSVRFAESNFGTNKYAEPTRFDFVERDDQYDESILDDVPNLDLCFNVLSYDELQAKFFESLNNTKDDDDEEEEEEEEDEEQQRKPMMTGKIGGKKQPVNDDEEDEDDEEEQEVEEEDDDARSNVVRQRQRKTKQVVEPQQSKKQPSCPSKHTFGVDNDRFDECDDCEVWNECYKANPKRKRQ